MHLSTRSRFAGTRCPMSLWWSLVEMAPPIPGWFLRMAWIRATGWWRFLDGSWADLASHVHGVGRIAIALLFTCRWERGR